MTTRQPIVAAITGAGSGIGRAVALELAGKGVRLALSDVDEASLDTTRVRAEARGAETRTRVVDVAESADVFRAPVADLLDPRNRGVTVIRRGGQEWRGPAFEVAGHVVWGFTAGLLDALFDSLGWTEPWDDERELPLPA